MSLGPLVVSENRRFLATADGAPFFWMGDTAWELFHRLDRDEAEHYLANRAEKGFNVVHAVALAEQHGLTVPNAYGELPLRDQDPARPNEAYFAHVDHVIARAEAHSLYVAFLPTWGDKVVRESWGEGPEVFDAANARAYGRFLGERYRGRTNLVWVLGGDRSPVGFEGLWRAMAGGIEEGLGSRPLCTYHPVGERSSGEWLHDEPWLDFDMLQSGHGRFDRPAWEMIARDYARRPAKPVLDGEPSYEDHPVDMKPQNGYFRDDTVRKQLYRSVFAGGCGVSYGHHSVWQFWREGLRGINFPDRPWREALDRPMAQQVRHLARLLLSRPFFSRVPDQSLLLSGEGEGGAHARATRGAEGRYAMVYLPEPAAALRVDLRPLRGERVRASWFDPRTGECRVVHEGPRRSELALGTPEGGPDWVLLVDDAAAGFALP